MNNQTNQNKSLENYWRKRLAEFEVPTPLIVDKSSKELYKIGERFNEIHITLSQIESNILQTFMQKNLLNLSSLVLGAWALLLYRYSGEQKVLFGTITDSELNNLLPFSIKIPPQTLLLSWLKNLQNLIAEQNEYTNVSFSQIRQWCNIPLNRPLFESVVILETNKKLQKELTGLHEYPLILTVQTDTQLELKLTYEESRFESETISRMLGHLKTLMIGMARNPSSTLSNLPLLTEEEQHQILVEWNDTRVDYPENKCLHQLFEQQVVHQPEKVAVIFRDQQLTYAELNRRSNQLAHYLRRLGVGPDILVGMFMERSLEMVIALYGILKAGGAYVPIDPSYPKDRIAFMVKDTQVPVLITQKHLVKRLPDHQATTLIIDAEWQKIALEKDENFDCGVTPENLAYVIYTSGSTGRPKGAVLNHRGRVNNFCDFNRRYNVGPGDKVLGLASLSFDMHAYDNFGLMAAGGANVIVESSAILDPGRWAELMLKHEITIWHSVPALLEMYVDYIENRPELWPESLRLILLGGDWIPVNLPDRIKSLVKGVHVVSMGGATECSMDSTIYDIEEPSSGWKSIPYGVPMANQLAYVLDPNFNPVPVGVPGELYLGGVGVGRGYHNRPQLTAERFVPNPFSGIPGDRMYRTGDLARYMPDGNLELLGRIDFQVKIRGFRVELGEITSALNQHPAVKEAVVVAKEIDPKAPAKGKQLVAYVVPETPSNESTEAALQEFNDDQISQWQEIYEETYSEPIETQDPTFNIIGWNSSYTGLPIPEEEMREWVNQSVQRILSLQPKRVLEIACGTGLLLFRVAPHCQEYVGTDFSRTGLDYIRRHLNQPEWPMPQVSLMQRMADNFQDLNANSFDLVILHSVVQLFPSINYFLRVLEGAVEVTRPGGYIYIGDVINLALMEAFHTSVQLYQAANWLPKDKLRQRIKKIRDKEEQLFIHPEFFLTLKNYFPKITQVEIQLRRGKYLNEMTRFRYDVVLYVESDANFNSQIQWLNWQNEKFTVAKLKELLNETKPDFLGIEAVPNARVAREIKAMELLSQSDGPATVGELRETLNHMSLEGFFDPEEFWSIGEELPYEVYVTWNREDFKDKFDVLFARKNGTETAKKIVPCVLNPRVTATKPLRTYANNPLQSVLIRKLIPELRTFLQEKLPDYMIPSAFVLLEALPLSPNGKIDRKSLPPPDQSRPELSTDFVPPRNAIEEVVASVWSEVFEMESIGVQDNFLELGGHSLLATQIMTRLQDIFPIPIPLRYIFTSPTVAELARCIEKAGKEARVDVEEVARTFIQINQLSDEEVRAMLDQNAEL